MGGDIRKEDLLTFFHAAQNELNEISRKARSLLYRYLDQNGLLAEPSKAAVVDIGWGGTAATVLWDVVPESRNWTWLYFGTRREYQPAATNHRAMFFTYGIPSEYHQVVFDCVEIVEFLFSAPETTTVALSETPLGVEPVFAPEESQWDGWAPRVVQMERGRADMMPALVRGATLCNGGLVDELAIFTLLNHIVRSEDATVIREFGQLQHQLGFGASRHEPLLSSGNMRYWRNIWRLLKGRSLKQSSGRRYWENQLTGQFLMPLTGVKRRIALKALRIQARGGLFRKKRRR